MCIKKISKFFKRRPKEEKKENLEEVVENYIIPEKEEKKEYPKELETLDILLKALREQLERNKFSNLPKDDYIRFRISKEEKEYLKQFCIDNNIEGGLSELIRISINGYICRKEIENGKE